MRRFLALGFSLSVAAMAARGGENITYRDGDTTLEGYLAVPPFTAEQRPGILIVHDWMGVHPGMKRIADEVANLGYVAFAADIYGQGVRPQNMDQAGTEATKYKSDRALFRRRVQAGLAELARQPRVLPGELAAMGYCFGGTGVLELARSGADIRGVVSFHGGLDTPTPQDAANIKCKVLILHGADDPLVPEKDVLAFQKEMRDAKVDWQMTMYGNAVHAFTNRDLPLQPGAPFGYNEKADKRSWLAMQNFYAEIFPAK